MTTTAERLVLMVGVRVCRALRWRGSRDHGRVDRIGHDRADVDQPLRVASCLECRTAVAALQIGMSSRCGGQHP